MVQPKCENTSEGQRVELAANKMSHQSGHTHLYFVGCIWMQSLV